MIHVPEFTIKPVDIGPLSEDIGYGNTLLKVPDAWVETKGAGIRVGVIDTGCIKHPDLPHVARWGEEGDASGHGTHVQGILAAKQNNTGMVGVAPEAEYFHARAVPGNWASMVNALEWMGENEIDVLNMSFGTKAVPPDTVMDAFDALVASGVVLVASAGNSGKPGVQGNNLDYPARCPQVIPVAAIDASVATAVFSSEGDELERGFAMPGVDVYSTWNDGNYQLLSGTSMAAPFLSGVIALLLSRHLDNPSMKTPIARVGAERTNDVVDHLRRMAVAIGDPRIFGYGYIDASLIAG